VQNCNFSDRFVSETGLKILILSARIDACHRFTFSGLSYKGINYSAVVEMVPEITEPTPKEKPKSTNMLPAILTLIVLASGGVFFVFKKVQKKKKTQEAAKPDLDVDYVDDDEDYGYGPEFEDDDADSSVDEDDNEPV